MIYSFQKSPRTLRLDKNWKIDELITSPSPVYFTLPPLFRRIPTDFHRTLPIPTDPADSPSDFQWIPLDLTKFRCLSGPSPVKVRWSHLEAENHRTGRTGQSDGLPMDFRWTSDGSKGRKREKYDKSPVRRTSTGLPMY